MTRKLTRRGLFGAAGALLVAPVLPAPLSNLHAAFAGVTETGRVSSSKPNICNLPRKAAPDGRWARYGGCYMRSCADGSLDVWKLSTVGATVVGFELMPEGFEPWRA